MLKFWHWILVTIEMSVATYVHPLSKDPGDTISDALRQQKLLAATIIEHGKGVHAATLYKEQNGYYICKNSYTNNSEISIPTTTPPWSSTLPPGLHIFDLLCGINISYSKPFCTQK